ncbi:MAG: rhomboid family intramembrane serine protease [Bdellovibrionales bacterium]
MSNKPNGSGSGNGHDPQNGKQGDKKEKIVKFPSLAERDRIRKKQNEEKEYRKSYKSKRAANNEPFFNFGKIPPFTKIIITSIVIIHMILSVFIDDSTRLQLIQDFGFTATKFLGGEGWNALALITPITYNFLHGDWVHLGFNALMGLALCTFVERMFSTPTVIKYFFLCGIGGAAVYYLINIGSSAPVIGASGSISGLFAAALLMMYEQGRFGAFTGKFANKGPWPLIWIWAGIMTFIGLVFGGVAWEAHLGGFLTGALLYHLMRKGKLRL